MPTQATNTTPHYHLSQWEENDRILRQDFNADLASIDTALAAHDSALAAKADATALTAVRENLSLVRLFDAALSANASSVAMDLSAVDMSRCTKLELHLGNVKNTLTSGYLGLRVNGSSGSADYGYNYTNTLDAAYLRVVELTTERAYWALSQLFSSGERLLHVGTNGSVDSAGVAVSTFSANSSSFVGIWRGGDLADVQTLTLVPSAGAIAAGLRVTLYGYFA